VNTKRLFFLIGLLALLAPSACRPSSVALPDQPTLPGPVEEIYPPSEPVEKDSPLGEEAKLPSLAAVADLSKRLGVSSGEITVVEAEAVIWPDASLGCPEPGLVYIQILSPGYRVQLSVAGVEYNYHTDQREQVVLCEETDVPGTSDDSPDIEPGLDPLIELAKGLLAEKLGIEPTQMEVLEARSMVWSNAALGCPQPDMNYIQVPQDGALIRLMALDSEYEYHSGGNRGLFLCETPAKLPISTSPNEKQVLPIDPDT
jgi:hypothetical protein